MIRPSKLSIAQHCGYSAALADAFPEGSAASENGTEWHKRLERVITGQAKDPHLEALVFTFPAHVKTECEVPLRLVDPDTDDLVTEGTTDIILTHDDGALTILDFKTGSPRNYQLQLDAYGIAAALTRKAPRFRTGVLYLDHPPLQLSEWRTAGADYWETLDRVKKAASADRTRPIVGAHCDECWSRKHCPSWLLPADAGADALAPFTTPTGLTRDNAARALQVVAAMKDAIKVADARLQDFARENGGIRDGAGKVWGPTPRRNRRWITLSALPQDLADECERRGLVKGGDMGEAFAWRLEKTASK